MNFPFSSVITQLPECTAYTLHEKSGRPVFASVTLPEIILSWANNELLANAKNNKKYNGFVLISNKFTVGDFRCKIN